MIHTIMDWDRSQWEIAETYFNMMNEGKAVCLEFGLSALNSARQLDSFIEVRDFWFSKKQHEPIKEQV